MIFYTISSNEGYFCGFRKRWRNWWFRDTPEFKWDTIPWHGEAICFPTREMAVTYASLYLRGLHTKVAQNDTGGRSEGINLRPPPA